MELRKKTEMIVVHCAATKPSMDIGYKEIRKWHVEDNGWDDVGYHYIVRRDGKVEVARSEAFQGAHAPAVNSKSIGVCLVGGMAEDGGAENNFTLEHKYFDVKMLGKRKDGSIIARSPRIKDKRIHILSVDLQNKKCRIVPKRKAI
ncbi:MAG: hypothetical protein CMO06_18525, partial [Thalassospira sp.]|uniref:N-acetylmuramoyl-L-alanine amidase n=1 Tax=Thalassospira sp. TaxID=1912094 RepID=UPI000C3F10B7